MVSNAGGVNPLACAAAIQEVVKKAGLDLKVAVVTGDDLIPHVSANLKLLLSCVSTGRRTSPSVFIDLSISSLVRGRALRRSRWPVAAAWAACLLPSTV